MTPRLTLNLGVRYDYLSPSTDRRNRLGNFDPSRLDAATLANGGPGLLNGFILPESADFGTIKGTPGVSDSTFSIANNLNFAPRIGFAWDPSGKRLLWTELKYHDGVRTPLPPDPQTQIAGLQDLAQNPPQVTPGSAHPAGQNALLVRRTRIGTYVTR